MVYAVMGGTAFLAGIVQGVTGFGGGIIMMLGLPFFFALPQGAGISSAVVGVLCALMAWRYRKEISLRKALLPCLLYIPLCSVAVRFSTAVNPAVIRRVFGAFLLALAAYYLFFNKAREKRRMRPWAGALCVALSAVCDGLFGIGGPPMVLYYLSATDSTREYLGTLQLFFLVNAIYITGFRFVEGVLLPEHLPCIALGAAGILAGMFLANRLVDRLNADLVRRLTYLMIGVSGIINLIK